MELGIKKPTIHSHFPFFKNRVFGPFLVKKAMVPRGKNWKFEKIFYSFSYIDLAREPHWKISLFSSKKRR